MRLGSSVISVIGLVFEILDFVLQGNDPIPHLFLLLLNVLNLGLFFVFLF
jgi:hypothetical protein